MSGRVQDLEIFVRDVEFGYVGFIGIGGQVGGDGAGSFHELAVELSANFATEHNIKRQMGGGEQDPDHDAKERHHAEAQRLRLNHFGSPSP